MTLALLTALLLAAPAAEAAPRPLGAEDAARNAPREPFRIAGNLYHVGTADIAAFLIVGSDGMVLLDGGYPQSAAPILRNVAKLGFDPDRIALLLNSQAHFDHAGGLAAIKAATGAGMIASAEDAMLLERGGRGDFAWGDDLAYPPVAVDRIVIDGEQVRLGDIVLTARITPGHTRGCTTWQLPVQENGRTLDALFLCGTTAPGYKLAGNAAYPGIVDDFRRSFATWKSLPCDLFLGAHGVYFDIDAKLAARREGGPNPFVDPEGCRAFIARSEQGIEAQLAAEQAAQPASASR